MDAPLLALTHGGEPPLSDDGAGAGAMRQLIQLRWLAAGGQLLTVLGVELVLRVALPLWPMLGVVATLALVNLASEVLLRRRQVTNVALMLALLVDVLSLTAQLYLSGGASNPFTSFYLLQVVLGAILLEAWSVWVLAGAAALCFAGVTLRSLPLRLPTALVRATESLYQLGSLIGFALTAGLLVLFVTRITRDLRARDRYLADLRQHAAEEDAIVRIGLFASGAAHELGTPLSTLSVILGDWRRMPRIAGDPELASELEEMRREVERCKAIVTDILHSAGEPRGEPMEGVRARTFLDDVVAAWGATPGNTPLEYLASVLDDERLVGGAPLRQAIWNVLDNAAEASPRGVRLVAERRDGDLAIVISDDGPGFAPAQLASVGMPNQSTKGTGQGMGLFLAATVARRQGGRLEAENRMEGGAEVRLILPLVEDREERR